MLTVLNTVNAAITTIATLRDVVRLTLTVQLSFKMKRRQSHIKCL